MEARVAKFVITYDLRKVRDYDKVYELLGKWKAVRILESVWLAGIEGTASQVVDALRKQADFDDGLAVIQLKNPGDWATVGVGDASLKWLRANIAP